ncbi:MAG: hypothetical protein JWP02_571, partial [Acidimicrobiales bacterium]|nr:hypothetical protein [Acidimicrobiales bacterium]
PLGWSYAQALSAPGGGTIGVRTVEWIRTIGGGHVVGWAENQWYAHHAPPVGGSPAPDLIPAQPSGAGPTSPLDHPASASPKGLPPPPPMPPPAAPALPGEGIWAPAGRLVASTPALYTTWVRPDTLHTSLVTGVAWMDTSLLATRMFAGSEQPGGAGWANTSPMAADQRTSLVAAFNSGFRLADSRGGYLAEGRTVRPLVPGAASLVITGNGTPQIGAWGTEVGMDANVVAVRQNLSLIVDGSHAVPNLAHSSTATWGLTVGNKTLVWRSGLGITATGALVYASGQGLSIASLADVLVRAGAVRAMELDINTSWVDFFSYTAPPGTPATAADGTKLVADMAHDPGRYFRSDPRDFLAVFAR